MNCDEWFNRLYEILDQDMDENVCRDLMAHMKDCQACLDRFEFEKRLQERTKEVLPRRDLLGNYPPSNQSLHPKTVKVLFSFKVLKFVFRNIVPARYRYGGVRAFSRLVYFLYPHHRRILVENLTPIVGREAAIRLAPAMYENFAMTSVDFFLPRRLLLKQVQVDNAGLLEKTWRRHKKVIFVTGHLGNWELGMSYLMSRGFTMAGLYAPYRDDDVVDWIMAHRNPDVEWIPVARGAAEACLNALDRGRLLGVVADVPYRERGRRVKIGHGITRLPLGPWAIAVRARAAVIPGFVLRIRPGHYRIVFEDPIIPGEGSFRRQIEQMQELYRSHLERYLQLYPNQWGLLEPFWEKQ